MGAERPGIAAKIAPVDFLAEAIAVPWPQLTPRRLGRRIQFPGRATAVVGMRRAGKTTFLHQMRREYHDRGIPRERLLYLNLEDERLAGAGSEFLTGLLEDYYRLFPQWRRRETVVWFLDEVQTLSGWERFVRRLLDSEKVEVFLTGSSAALLSREIATSMRGRACEVAVFPFSFWEFLLHHGLEIPESPQLLPPEGRSALDAAFRQYLTQGAFPEAQNIDASTRHRLLADYVDVVMLRDVVERHSVSNVASLRWLVRHLLGNPGGLFSVEKFHAALKSQGLAVSRDTLHHLLSYVEDAFLVRITWMASGSERQRMVNPRKIYPIDPGFIALYDRTGKANLGHALETAVRVELERRDLDVWYVRTGEGLEVDFLACSREGEQTLIQVCADLRSPATREREVRALLAAAGQFPRASLSLLTLTPECTGDIPGRIDVHDAAVWFLMPWVNSLPAQ